MEEREEEEKEEVPMQWVKKETLSNIIAEEISDKQVSHRCYRLQEKQFRPHSAHTHRSHSHTSHTHSSHSHTHIMELCSLYCSMKTSSQDCLNSQHTLSATDQRSFLIVTIVPSSPTALMQRLQSLGKEGKHQLWAEGRPPLHM